MAQSPPRARWRNPITIIEIVAVAAVVLAILIVVVRSGVFTPAAQPDAPAATPVATMTAATAAATPTAVTATAVGPETCLQFETGVQECQSGLTWSAHICWATSSGATLQMKTPSGAWTNIAVADVLKTSDFCSGDYPVEVSIEYTETQAGTYYYRFFNHQTKTSPGAAGDVYTVTVTKP